MKSQLFSYIQISITEYMQRGGSVSKKPVYVSHPKKSILTYLLWVEGICISLLFNEAHRYLTLLYLSLKHLHKIIYLSSILNYRKTSVLRYLISSNLLWGCSGIKEIDTPSGVWCSVIKSYRSSSHTVKDVKYCHVASTVLYSLFL